MRIGDREIGPSNDVYIIAELGVNHDGSVNRALQLTDAAADAGADAIKLQLFKTDLLMSKAAKLAAYQQAAGETDPVAMLRRLELPIADMTRVVARAHARGVHAIVTVFSLDLVPEAETLPWDAYKTASPDIIHKPLLDALAASGRPLIVSTGASTPDEVARAARWLEPARDRLAFLQCVSAYPTAPDDASIGGVEALRSVAPGPVGYSDHTAQVSTGAVAVHAGARILEKHLTYDPGARGPDHAASLSPAGFRKYVGLARQADKHPRRSGEHADQTDPRVGPPIKRVLDIERDVRTVSRQSLVTRCALPAGHRITRADLTIKRPGTAIEPWRFDEIVGRPTARPVEADVPLLEDDLGPAR